MFLLWSRCKARQKTPISLSFQEAKAEKRTCCNYGNVDQESAQKDLLDNKRSFVCLSSWGYLCFVHPNTRFSFCPEGTSGIAQTVEKFCRTCINRVGCSYYNVSYLEEDYRLSRIYKMQTWQQYLRQQIRKDWPTWQWSGWKEEAKDSR